MIINNCPSSCPRCKLNFEEHYDVLKKDFEDKHVAILAKVRSNARYKGIIKGFLWGVLVPTVLLGLEWKDYQQQSFVEHITSYFSEYPLLTSLMYAVCITLLVLIEGTGKVNSREEQQWWNQFEQEHRKENYLRFYPLNTAIGRV